MKQNRGRERKTDLLIKLHSCVREPPNPSAIRSVSIYSCSSCSALCSHSAPCSLLNLACSDRSQPAGPIKIITDTIQQRGIRGLYAGCTALVTGNAVKAGVRFLSYDQYKTLLRDEEVSLCTGLIASPKGNEWQRAMGKGWAVLLAFPVGQRRHGGTRRDYKAFDQVAEPI